MLNLKFFKNSNMNVLCYYSVEFAGTVRQTGPGYQCGGSAGNTEAQTESESCETQTLL